MKNDINYRQINWQNLYNVNRASFATINDANGIIGNTVSGRRSRYIIEERVINTKRFNANSVINTKFGDNIDFTAGASYQFQNNHYYKKVDDLLGGDFYLNVNQFAERDFPLIMWPTSLILTILTVFLKQETSLVMTIISTLIKLLHGRRGFSNSAKLIFSCRYSFSN